MKSKTKMIIVIVLLGLVWGFLKRDDYPNRFLCRGLVYKIYTDYGKYVNLYSICIDKSNKTCHFHYKLRMNNFDNDDEKSIILNKVRLDIEDYFEAHNLFFLDSGYKIDIYFTHIVGAYKVNCFRFSNYDVDHPEVNTGRKLGCVSIRTGCKLSTLAVYNDAKTLYIDGMNIDDINIFTEFKELEYLKMSTCLLSQQQKKLLATMLQNCEVEY